jgi:tryptophan synthase alpha chain
VKGACGARYAVLFEALRARNEGAFVPFFVLGDPDLETSARLLRAAVCAGADALEVGIPFSDPIADGPTLQRASLRAAAAGASAPACFELLAALRRDVPNVPVGLLTYANLVVQGGVDAFYARAARAGVDSVLVADLPLLEAAPFSRAARAAGVAPILLAPPNLPRARIRRLVELSDGYTYCVARKGVTGIGAARGGPVSAAGDTPETLIAELRAAGAPPPLVGFGIAAPVHVQAAIAAGAAGAISGSAVAQILEAHAGDRDRSSAVETVCRFIHFMKEASRNARRGSGAAPAST